MLEDAIRIAIPRGSVIDLGRGNALPEYLRSVRPSRETGAIAYLIESDVGVHGEALALERAFWRCYATPLGEKRAAIGDTVELIGKLIEMDDIVEFERNRDARFTDFIASVGRHSR